MASTVKVQAVAEPPFVTLSRPFSKDRITGHTVHADFRGEKAQMNADWGYKGGRDLVLVFRLDACPCILSYLRAAEVCSAEATELPVWKRPPVSVANGLCHPPWALDPGSSYFTPTDRNRSVEDPGLPGMTRYIAWWTCFGGTFPPFKLSTFPPSKIQSILLSAFYNPFHLFTINNDERKQYSITFTNNNSNILHIPS